MPAVIPQSVQQVLDEYTALIHEQLPGLLAGVYLHGSLALGAFDPRLSDIDFISITSRRCSATDIDSLRAIHDALRQRYPQAHLEGSYLQSDDLGRFEDTIPPHPHIHDGVLHISGHFDINAVTWWVLKHRGITVVGPPAEHFDYQVDWDDLIAKMHHNMNTYWASFTTNPRRIAWLLTDDGIQWAVLGVLRQFYTFREHAITSKISAGIYGLQHTPRRWQHLIQEALDIRAGMATSSYRSRVVRALAAYTFLQLIITACNTNSARVA
jgi:Domain of unknown function (DUF4111)